MFKMGLGNVGAISLFMVVCVVALLCLPVSQAQVEHSAEDDADLESELSENAVISGEPVEIAERDIGMNYVVHKLRIIFT